MEERRFRVGSFVEWLLAAGGVAGVIWLLSVPVQRVVGPRVEAALVDAPVDLPPGVPTTATSIPVMLLLDGREIRVGDLHSRLVQVLPERAATGPMQRSSGDKGERQTRGYNVNGTRFFVVCERSERGAPLRVSAIYLP